MRADKSYIYSFYLGFTIQLALLPIATVELFGALLVSLLNMLATMFVYPWFFVWMIRGSWSVPIRFLEPPN